MAPHALWDFTSSTADDGVPGPIRTVVYVVLVLVIIVTRRRFLFAETSPGEVTATTRSATTGRRRAVRNARNSTFGTSCVVVTG